MHLAKESNFVCIEHNLFHTRHRKEENLTLKYFEVWWCLAKVQVPIFKRNKKALKTMVCEIKLE